MAILPRSRLTLAAAALAALAGAASTPTLAQGGADPVEGTWYGVADAPPDSGLPVSVRLRVRLRGDSVFAPISSSSPITVRICPAVTAPGRSNRTWEPSNVMMVDSRPI